MILTIIEYLTVSLQTPLAECTVFQFLLFCEFIPFLSVVPGYLFGEHLRDLQNAKSRKDGD